MKIGLTVSAYAANHSICSLIYVAIGSEKIAPEYKPVTILIKVIPICIVENISFGSSASLIAIRAPRLPASAFSSNKPLRALIIANSVMENRPFKIMSMTTIKISIPMSLPTDSISPYRFLSEKI